MQQVKADTLLCFVLDVCTQKAQLQDLSWHICMLPGCIYGDTHAWLPAGESANGKFSDTAVRTMAAIVANAEVGVDYYSQFNFIR